MSTANEHQVGDTPVVGPNRIASLDFMRGIAVMGILALLLLVSIAFAS